ncbi:ABC transporter permease [Dysgonomonas sp. 25]|uniref:ABC transporter permease n=1 Tax=Dysgonomonas sp. 25 TaxID=2302933 RepID=UPI0013D674A2|nr:ABC transporter permease [Dysgonomonas sp. 25]NDV69044.1 ABC transporter permease [Dysgonomonas sp. 25]
MTDSNKEHWDLVIKPQSKLFTLNLKEVWTYRDLVQMYIRRDIVTMYKQTILGPLWFVIQPLFTSILFMFVFGGVAQISTDGLPQMLFYLSGILTWTYFADCLNKSSGTFSSNAGVFSKVYFPRLVVPISSIISNLVKLGIQLLLFLGIYLYFYLNGAKVHFTEYIFLFPVLIMMSAGLGFGIGIIVSSLTTKYRDLAILFTFIVQLWMYVTPVIYPLSIMEENYAKYMWIIQLNPMTSIVETTRYAFMGVGTFTWASLLYSFVFTVVIMLIGIITFNKIERRFIDIV